MSVISPRADPCVDRPTSTLGIRKNTSLLSPDWNDWELCLLAYNAWNFLASRPSNHHNKTQNTTPNAPEVASYPTCHPINRGVLPKSSTKVAAKSFTMALSLASVTPTTHPNGLATSMSTGNSWEAAMAIKIKGMQKRGLQQWLLRV